MTFLKAYDLIKGSNRLFQLCEDEDELSGEDSCICVYRKDVKPDEDYSFVGKLRWRINEGKPGVDEELVYWLEEYKKDQKKKVNKKLQRYTIEEEH